MQPELPWKGGDDAFALGPADELDSRQMPDHEAEPSPPSNAFAYPRSGEANARDSTAADSPAEPPAAIGRRAAATLAPPPVVDDADDWIDTSEELESTDALEDAELDDHAMTRHHASVIPCFVIFFVVVTSYFFFSRMLLSDQDIAETFVSRLPLVGSSLAADRLLFRKVALTDVAASFVRLKEGKEVFVISGTALNTATRPLRNIQLQGSLLDQAGRELRREVITCGGMLSRRLLTDLTARELDILRKVEPQKRFSLAPGESTPFAIIFPEVPSGATGYVSRVAAAQRQS